MFARQGLRVSSLPYAARRVSSTPPSAPVTAACDSSLWQTVEQVQPEPWPEPIPVPEVADSDWGALDEAQGGDEPMWRVMA